MEQTVKSHLFGQKLSGIWKRNVVLSMGLGLVPAVSMSTSLKSSLAISLIYAIVLIPTYLFAAMVKLKQPRYVRIPLYALVAGVCFIPAYLLAQLLFPTLREMLGVYLFVVVMDMVVIFRADAYARINRPIMALADGLANAIGLLIVVCAVGAFREILGEGTIWGIRFGGWSAPAVSMPMFGFIILGFLGAMANKITHNVDTPTEKMRRKGRMKHKTLGEEVSSVRAQLEDKQNLLLEDKRATRGGKEPREAGSDLLEQEAVSAVEESLEEVIDMSEELGGETVEQQIARKSKRNQAAQLPEDATIEVVLPKSATKTDDFVFKMGEEEQ